MKTIIDYIEAVELLGEKFERLGTTPCELIEIRLKRDQKSRDIMAFLLYADGDEHEFNAYKIKHYPPLVFTIIKDWEDNLTWCPSQCYLKIEHKGKHYVIYLRWRHSDPWTADLYECFPDGEFYMHSGKEWFNLPIKYWRNEQLKELKNNAIQKANEWFLKRNSKNELYRLKKELITPKMRQVIPSVVEAKFSLKWWLDNKLAKAEDLEVVKK